MQQDTLQTVVLRSFRALGLGLSSQHHRGVFLSHIGHALTTLGRASDSRAAGLEPGLALKVRDCPGASESFIWNMEQEINQRLQAR